MNINSIVVTIRATAVIASIAALSGGCYLLQSAEGQFALMSKRRAHLRSSSTSPPRRPRCARSSKSVTAIRDFASRRAGAAGQRQLSQVRGRRPRLRGVECGRGAGIFGRSQEVVLSHRRMRRLSRLLRRGRSAPFRRGSAREGLRCGGRRRRGVFHARTLRRSDLEHHGGLERCGAGRDHFPRADASAAVRAPTMRRSTRRLRPRSRKRACGAGFKQQDREQDLAAAPAAAKALSAR